LWTEDDRATLEVGRVLRPHGLRGELKVELYWPGSESLLVGRSVRVTGEGVERPELRIEAARKAGRFALIKLESVDDRNAAERLRGVRLYVARAGLPPLQPGEYYLVDLVGAEVLGPGGRVGRVVGVCAYPSVDALIVELEDGSRAEQPISPPFVERVDAVAKVVVLATTDGLVA